MRWSCFNCTQSLILHRLQTSGTRILDSPLKQIIILGTMLEHTQLSYFYCLSYDENSELLRGCPQCARLKYVKSGCIIKIIFRYVYICACGFYLFLITSHAIEISVLLNTNHTATRKDSSTAICCNNSNQRHVNSDR